MKIEIETGSYNQRRYSKPWIARVDFTTNSQGDFKFGEWIGDASNGSAGLLEIDVEPGDIIAKGQKDFRKPRNSAPDWFVAGPDAKLVSLPGKVEALREFRKKAQGDLAQAGARGMEDACGING